MHAELAPGRRVIWRDPAHRADSVPYPAGQRDLLDPDEQLVDVAALGQPRVRIDPGRHLRHCQLADQGPDGHCCGLADPVRPAAGHAAS